MEKCKINRATNAHFLGVNFIFFPAFLLAPSHPHKGSVVFSEHWLTVRNKVFACLTLLKIQVIEYGKLAFKVA